MTKEEYGEFVLRYKGSGACFPMYLSLSRFEKMWFSAIQKDIAELEDKLANANYQLEGRDLEIKELEKENAELKEKNRQLKNEVDDLSAYCNQIGKIKTDVLKLFEHIVAR